MKLQVIVTKHLKKNKIAMKYRMHWLNAIRYKNKSG